MLPTTLQQQWPKATRPQPIVIIGAGSIVRDAHLPVYQRLGYPVAGIFDVNPAASREQAKAFGIAKVFTTLEQATKAPNAIFDLAVPPAAIVDVLPLLPAGSAVLIQKPMGRDIEDARRIREIARARRLTAAVNFQLRFAPNMLALRDALSQSLLGQVMDVEVRLTLHTPWGYWAFLKGVPRMEVLVHSIHYLDLIRALVGDPTGVYCRGARHIDLPDYPDARTSIILDYGDLIRCSLTMNHTHTFGHPSEMVSQLKIEGTRGAAVAKMGVNLNYPQGEDDTLEIITEKNDWSQVPLRGSWFLEAFEGPMSNLQRVVAGEDPALVSSVEDAFQTMAVVEACYESSARGSTPIPA